MSGTPASLRPVHGPNERRVLLRWRRMKRRAQQRHNVGNRNAVTEKSPHGVLPAVSL